MLAVDVLAPHLVVVALAPAMAVRGEGDVVSMGPWTARVGVPSGAMHTATEAAIEPMTPAGVPVRPVDVALAVRWLVSEEPVLVNGSIVDVDGGLVATRMG